MSKPRVVVCGGGAGGLELVVRLAARGDLDLVLVDRRATHLWKPLLHELASGSLDPSDHEVSYLALAQRYCFTFAHGWLDNVDRHHRVVRVAPVSDETGTEIIPARDFHYDLAVIAIGGTTNNFGIKGVKENALMLDTPEDAEAIRSSIVKACMIANYAPVEARPDTLQIVIVGGGATGVELAAELRSTTRTLISYGLDQLDAETFIGITVVNADARLLVQLPERISSAIRDELSLLGIQVDNSETVEEVTADGIVTRSGRTFKADIVIWTAGVRGAAGTGYLDSLETTRSGQLVVLPDLRTTRDDRVLAIGDCAACPWPSHSSNVPARAQASHQQARHVADHIARYLADAPVLPFEYRDLGSLVSLGPQAGAVGTLMGFITGRSLRVSGLLAGLFYRWLYKRHRAALFGWWVVMLETLSHWSDGLTRPKIKLH